MKKIYQVCLKIILRFYVEYVASPWVIAKFYAAWEEYQKSDVYRERITTLGFKYAYEIFLNSKPERLYYLKMRMSKEPLLKWQIRLAPFNFSIPDVLQTARDSGFFDNKTGP